MLVLKIAAFPGSMTHLPTTFQGFSESLSHGNPKFSFELILISAVAHPISSFIYTFFSPGRQLTLDLHGMILRSLLLPLFSLFAFERATTLCASFVRGSHPYIPFVSSVSRIVLYENLSKAEDELQRVLPSKVPSDIYSLSAYSSRTEDCMSMGVLRRT